MNGPIDEYAVTLVDRLRKARERGADEVEACKRVLGTLIDAELAHRYAEECLRVERASVLKRVDSGKVGDLRRLLAGSAIGDEADVVIVRNTPSGPARLNCWDAEHASAARVGDYEQSDALYIEVWRA